MVKIESKYLPNSSCVNVCTGTGERWEDNLFNGYLWKDPRENHALLFSTFLVPPPALMHPYLRSQQGQLIVKSTIKVSVGLYESQGTHTNYVTVCSFKIWEYRNVPILRNIWLPNTRRRRCVLLSLCGTKRWILARRFKFEVIQYNMISITKSSFKKA